MHQSLTLDQLFPHLGIYDFPREHGNVAVEVLAQMSDEDLQHLVPDEGACARERRAALRHNRLISSQADDASCCSGCART